LVIFLGYALTFAWVFAVMGISHAAKKFCRIGEEGSRKIVHVLVSFAFFPMYFCFGASWHLLVPPLCFVVLNYISVKKSVFSMMERSGERQSYGTVIYALSMLVMAAFSVLCPAFLLPYGVGLFCMSFGDGLAPIFGSVKRMNFSIFGGQRTALGSLTVFVMSFVVTFSMSAVFSMGLRAYECALVAAFSALMELVGTRGLDNATLPLGVSCLTFVLMTM